MRLITRSDFDGLACGALLLAAKVVDSWMFAHPKDIQDGLVPVTENDVLANVPFAPGCGLWFDHHSSEKAGFLPVPPESYMNITAARSVSRILTI